MRKFISCLERIADALAHIAIHVASIDARLRQLDIIAAENGENTPPSVEEIVPRKKHTRESRKGLCSVSSLERRFGLRMTIPQFKDITERHGIPTENHKGQWYVTDEDAVRLTTICKNVEA